MTQFSRDVQRSPTASKVSSHAAIRTLALIARSVDYGESDRILTLLTRGSGKLAAMARSARSSRKRFGGALGLFVLGEATLVPRRRGDLLLLDRFERVQDWSVPLAASAALMAQGSYVIELARELSPERQPEPALFDVVVHGLSALAAYGSIPGLVGAVELRLLEAAGVALSLEQCVCCGVPAELGGVGISVHQGGVVCRSCGPAASRLAAPVHRRLAQLSRASFDEPRYWGDVDDNVTRQVDEILELVVQHHLGKSLRSRDVRRQLEGPGANGTAV